MSREFNLWSTLVDLNLTLRAGWRMLLHYPNSMLLLDDSHIQYSQLVCPDILSIRYLY
jgi:hypothetical protein